MANPIERALREAKSAVLQIALLNSVLDSMVMFVLLLLGTTVLSLPVGYALLPALIYAIVHTWGNVREVNFAFIEKKTPSLEEQLITVADNWQKKNDVVKQLCDDVLKKMKDVRTSSFVDFGKLTREVAVMAVASFIIIGAAAFNVQFLDLPGAVDELREFKPFEEYDVNQELLEYEESQNLSEILGERSVTELGQKQLELELNPIKSDVDIGKVRDPEDKRFREVPPAEIKASTGASYEEDIPKEYQRIVKTYFKEITRS